MVPLERNTTPPNTEGTVPNLQEVYNNPLATPEEITITLRAILNGDRKPESPNELFQAWITAEIAMPIGPIPNMLASELLSRARKIDDQDRSLERLAALHLASAISNRLNSGQNIDRPEIRNRYEMLLRRVMARYWPNDEKWQGMVQIADPDDERKLSKPGPYVPLQQVGEEYQ